jgi:anti-sigma factor RsiW
MRMESTGSDHMDDPQLVRYIDREGSPDDRRHWDAHLGSCPRCRSEVATLRDQSAAITAWLDRADFERGAHAPAATAAAPLAAPPVGPIVGTIAPTGGAHPPAPTPTAAGRSRLPFAGAGSWLKAAVIVLLVAAPLVAITPARGWVADRLGLADTEQHLTPAARAVGEMEAAAAVIRFAPAPGTFQVAIEAPQERGDLTLGRVDAGSLAVLEVVGAGPWPEAVVSAQGVRIENEAAAAASYRLLLPPEVTAVGLTLAGRQVLVAGPEIDRGTVLRLDRLRDRP